MKPETLDLLDELVRLHRFSLIRYLRYADPWAENREATEVLRQISDMQEATAERLETVILEHDGPLPVGDFPLEYTSLNDVALQYVLPKAVAYQRALIAALRDAVDQLDNEPRLQAMVEEALGEAKGHLETLEELAGTPAASA